MIKLSINHKERKTNVLCFAQTSITSSNLADSSHWTGALAAVQSEKPAHHSGFSERYQGSSTCSEKDFQQSLALTLLTVFTKPLASRWRGKSKNLASRQPPDLLFQEAANAGQRGHPQGRICRWSWVGAHVPQWDVRDKEGQDKWTESTDSHQL